MQAAGANLSLGQHASAIVRERGLKGLYRGVMPTVFRCDLRLSFIDALTDKHHRAGILTSSQLASYDWTKTTLKQDFPLYFQEGLRTHLVCSGIAGFVCSVASAPGEFAV